MIGIIGYQDEVIGFGLAGITRIIELTKGVEKKEVFAAIENLAKDAEAIFINESLHNLVKQMKDLPKIILIDIPEDKHANNLEEVESLIKETLGISL